MPSIIHRPIVPHVHWDNMQVQRDNPIVTFVMKELIVLIMDLPNVLCVKPERLQVCMGHQAVYHVLRVGIKMGPVPLHVFLVQKEQPLLFKA